MPPSTNLGETLLAQVFSQTFRNWTAYQMAVDKKSANIDIMTQWLIQVTKECLVENNLDTDCVDELSEWIGEIILNEFDTFIEDGSLAQISLSLLTSWTLFKNNETDKLSQLLIETNQFTTSSAQFKNNSIVDRTEESEESDDEEDEPMETEEVGESSTTRRENLNSTPKNVPDEDGWVTITKKGGKKK